MNTLIAQLKVLCKGKPEEIRAALERPHHWLRFCVTVILAGSGVYGATIGIGRAPLQAFYTAVKFPLLILLTTAGNALLNGMLAFFQGRGVMSS